MIPGIYHCATAGESANSVVLIGSVLVVTLVALTAALVPLRPLNSGVWGAGSFTAPQHWRAEFTSALEVVQTLGVEPRTS